jgi:hypothetical protein
MWKIPFTCSDVLRACYDAASSSYYTAPMMLNDKLAGTGRPSPKQFPGMIRKPKENVKVSVNPG